MIHHHLPFWSMRQKSFGDCFNTKTHGMSDEHLRESLVRLVGDGFLREISPEETCLKSHTYFGLTNAGGWQWEAERCPIWDRFLCMWGNRLCPKFSFGAYGLNANYLADFIRLYRNIRIIPDGEMEVRCCFARNFKNHRFVPWRTFPGVYCRAILIPKPIPIFEAATLLIQPEFTMEQYEQERTWWTSIREMQKFL